MNNMEWLQNPHRRSQRESPDRLQNFVSGAKIISNLILKQHFGKESYGRQVRKKEERKK